MERPLVSVLHFEGIRNNRRLEITADAEQITDTLISNFGFEPNKIPQLVFEISPERPSHQKQNPELHPRIISDGNNILARIGSEAPIVSVFTGEYEDNYQHWKRAALFYCQLSKESQLPTDLQEAVNAERSVIEETFATRKLIPYLQEVSPQRADTFLEKFLIQKIRRDIQAEFGYAMGHLKSYEEVISMEREKTNAQKQRIKIIRYALPAALVYVIFVGPYFPLEIGIALMGVGGAVATFKSYQLDKKINKLVQSLKKMASQSCSEGESNSDKSRSIAPFFKVQRKTSEDLAGK